MQVKLSVLFIYGPYRSQPRTKRIERKEKIRRWCQRSDREYQRPIGWSHGYLEALKRCASEGGQRRRRAFRKECRRWNVLYLDRLKLANANSAATECEGVDANRQSRKERTHTETSVVTET
jgi:hypothetical protein